MCYKVLRLDVQRVWTHNVHAVSVTGPLSVNDVIPNGRENFSNLALPVSPGKGLVQQHGNRGAAVDGLVSKTRGGVMLRDKTSWRILAAVMLVTAMVGLVPQVWAANRYRTLHRFTGQDGASPRSDLILDASGNLYGTTVSGGTANVGTVFELTPQADGSWRETVLYNFCSKTNCSDGYFPVGRLAFDQSGSLYGTTQNGGTYFRGTVFELTPQADGSWRETALYNFCCSDGYPPSGGVIFDRSGNLYGTTSWGGISDNGVVFRLTPNRDGKWTEQVLYNFCSDGICTDGEGPFGGLVFDNAGSLYGATQFGGVEGCNFGCGVVFELTVNSHGTWKEKLLHQFSSVKDGYNTLAALIFDGAGDLYGTTSAGGVFGSGTVFELIPDQRGKWKHKILRSFTGGADGGEPASELAFDGAGNLYGTTAKGGDLTVCNLAGCGVVFKLTQKADRIWFETLLHRFHDRPGAEPVAGVVLDAAGNLYGTTQGDGSSSEGSVYQIIF
jgi:uncharacterized repeat protein (TIGR03803 family)